MNGIKKTFAVAAAVSLVCLSSVGAMAANKLIVRNAGNTADAFVVTDSGYIGVGGAPTFPFQITGAGANTTSSIYLINNGRTAVSASDSPGMYFMRNNVAAVGGIARVNDQLGFIFFGSQVSGATKTGALISTYATGGAWSATSNPASMVFFTADVGATALTERLRIRHDGLVGIGNSSPTQKLDVNGAIRFTTTGARPTCAVGIRGTFWLTQGTTDVLSVCSQVSGGYSWRNVTLL